MQITFTLGGKLKMDLLNTEKCLTYNQLLSENFKFCLQFHCMLALDIFLFQIIPRWIYKSWRVKTRTSEYRQIVMPFTRVVCCNCNILTVSQDLKQKKRPRLHTIKYVASEDIQMRSGKIIELSNLTNIANCSEIQNTHVSENLRCEDVKCYKD